MQQLLALPDAPIRWQHRAADAIGLETDSTPGLERSSAQGCRDPDSGLDRRRVIEPNVDRPVQVEVDPQVRRPLDLELLDLQLAMAGAGPPMDAVEAVRRDVRPDARDQGRRLDGSFRARRRALGHRGWQLQQRQWFHARRDHHGRARSHGRIRLEQAQRVTRADDHGVDPMVAAARERHRYRPAPLLAAAQAQGTTRDPDRHRRRIVDVQPQFGQMAPVPDRVADGHGLTHLGGD